MSTFALINLLLLIIIFGICFYLIYTFNIRIDRTYIQAQGLSESARKFVINYEMLESCSIGWVFSLIIFKYFICPWRRIETSWISHQIWIGLILYLAIEIIGAFILFKLKRKQ